MNAAGRGAFPKPGAGEAALGRTSGLAVWSFVLGLLAFCLWIPALPGLILGIMALVKIRGAKGQLSGTGLGIAGVVTSAVALIVAPVALAIMIPAATKVKEKAEEAKAQAKATEVHTGLLAYFKEYGHLPVVRQAQPEDVGTTSEGGLIQVLLGRSRELNPRGIVFLADPAERLVDPWGHPFQVALDGNLDGRVTLPAPGAAARTIESRVVVWSLGPDGQTGSKDDILVY